MKATMILALTLTVMMSLMVSTSAQRFGQWEFFVLSTPEAECEDEVATADIRTGRIRDHLDLFSNFDEGQGVAACGKRLSGSTWRRIDGTIQKVLIPDQGVFRQFLG